MCEELQILVEACKQNKRQAQGEIYKLFSPKLYAVCLRYSKNEADAQDNLQEAFLLAFDKIYQYKGKGSFEGWLRRLTVNVCLEKLRKKNYFEELTDKNQYLENDEADELEIEDDNTFEIVQNCIAEMPVQYQAVFNLYLVEEYSHKEIAEMLSISEGTSKSNLSRAKNWLRNRLEKENITSFYVKK